MLSPRFLRADPREPHGVWDGSALPAARARVSPAGSWGAQRLSCAATRGSAAGCSGTKGCRVRVGHFCEPGPRAARGRRAGARRPRHVGFGEGSASRTPRPLLNCAPGAGLGDSAFPSPRCRAAQRAGPSPTVPLHRPCPCPLKKLPPPPPNSGFCTARAGRRGSGACLGGCQEPGERLPRARRARGGRESKERALGAESGAARAQIMPGRLRAAGGRKP